MDFRRNFLLDEGGVSEVVGSILTLAITVVLFSSIFAGVQYLEGPTETQHVRFSATATDDYVNISHDGGKPLKTVSTRIYLILDGNSHFYRMDNSSVTLSGRDSTRWELGEDVYIDHNLALKSAQSAQVLIVDSSSNKVIWRKDLITSPEGEGIVIKNAGVDYPLSWEDYASPEEKVIMWADVRVPGADPEDINVTIDIPTNISDKNKRLFKETYYKLNYTGYRHSHQYTVEEIENGTYMVKVIAKYGGNKTSTYVDVNVGSPDEVANPPDLVVGDLEFNPQVPEDKESVTITANIYNQGTINLTSNLTFSDEGVNISSPSMQNKFTPGPVPTEVSLTYTINGSGNHEIKVSVSNITATKTGDEIEDPTPKNNQRTEILQVDPSILLVDDDQVSEGKDNDELSAIEAGLNEKSLDADKTSPIPMGTDGPSYTGGKYPLQDYGVVIWLTGDNDDKLTDNDQDSLKDYISNGGKLWLIGENLEDGALENNFMKTYLGVKEIDQVTPHLDGPSLQSPSPDENGTYGRFKYPIETGAGGDYTQGDHITPVQPYDNDDLLKDDVGAGNTVGYGFNYSVSPQGGKSVLNSFLFSDLRGVSKGTMIQEVFEWMIDLKNRGGKDVSVASQEIVPQAPMYKNNVTISAVLRNNGDKPLDVPVRLQVDDNPGLLKPINQSKESLYIPGNGETRRVNFTWVAEPVGVHDLKVIADPYEQIEEINEVNNDITYKNINVTKDDVTVDVRFSVLVVDDDQKDGSVANGNTSRIYSTILDNLNHGGGRYAYNVTYVGKSQPGPRLNYMKSFNAVFWITGTSSNTLTPTDITRLIDPNDQLSESPYLESTGGNLLMVGDNVIGNLTGWDLGEQMLEKLGVDTNDPIHTDEVGPAEMLGMKEHDVSHGLKYELKSTINTDWFEGVNSNGDVLFQGDDGEKNLGSSWANGNNKALMIGRNLTTIKGSVRDEFTNWPSQPVDTSEWPCWEEIIFMSSRWFGMKDKRPELRVTGEDIEISSEHPMVGRSYQIRAEIENVGYKAANVLVRVKDGTQHIGSDTVYVPGSTRVEKSTNFYQVTPGNATVEMSWQPLSAGERDIRVEVDPMNLVEEVNTSTIGSEDMQLNNLGLVKEKVFFFWDDMENGTGNWEHDATMMNINGESPLDFINRENIDTNVKGSWHDSLTGSIEDDGTPHSGGVYDTTDSSVENFTHGAAHTKPHATWMPETEGGSGRKPIDMVIVLDYSGSMDEEEGDMEMAAKTAVGVLSDQDRVAVFPFSYDPWSNYIGFTYCTDSNKQTINNTIDSWSTGGSTALYDTTAFAGEYLQNNGRGGDVVKGFIGITDGGSNNDEDDYTHAPDTGYGKDDYAIRNDWENPNLDWNGYTEPYYGNSFPHSQNGGTYGCMGMPWNVNAVGLGPYVDSDWRWVGWTGGDSTPSGSQTSKLNWYNHTNNPDELKQIFKNFVKAVESEAGGIKSVPPGGGGISPDSIEVEKDMASGPKSPEHEKKETKDNSILDDSYDISKREYRYAVTEEITVQDANNATLSFWQKYWMTEGTNGGIIYLWNTEGGNNWVQGNRYYLKPKQSYTGNLRFGEVDDDSSSGGPYNNGLRDADNQLPYWCFNGRSTEGSFGWEYTEVDLTPYVSSSGEDIDHFKLVFVMAQLGGVSKDEGWQPEMGWYIDDVKVDVSADGPPDFWKFKDDAGKAHSGSHYWAFYENAGNALPQGVDSSLTTTPIDLTSAKKATLSAYMRFNIDPGAGLPPDGFRIEVSDDNGRTWDSITYGVRAAWGASGTMSDSDGDGETYAGVNKQNPGAYGWVEANTLRRLNVDLSGWAGETIRLRFRVYTNTTEEYATGNPKGFFLDDVVVKGRSIGMDEMTSTTSAPPGDDGKETSSSSDGNSRIEAKAVELKKMIASQEKRVKVDNNNRRIVFPLDSSFDREIRADNSYRDYEQPNLALPVRSVKLRTPLKKQETYF